MTPGPRHGHRHRARAARWLAAALCVWAGTLGRSPADPGGSADEAPPPRPGTVADGGRAAVVFFILSDCPVANALVPAMNAVVADYREKGVGFTFAHVDPEIADAAVAAHAKAFSLAAPAMADRDHSLVRKAGAKVTPEAAIFLPDGSLAYRGRINNLYVGYGERRGEITEHDVRRALDAVLANKPVPPPRGDAVGCYIEDFAP